VEMQVFQHAALESLESDPLKESVINITGVK
jgi:hypothetical protein